MEKPTYLERLAQHGVDGAHPGGLPLTQHLIQAEQITKSSIILDVGCGTGQTAAYLGVNYPCQIVAIDLNPKMIAAARQKFARYQLEIPLFQADAAALPFRRNLFTIVLSESVTVFTEISRSLREYYRVLRAGGRLLAIEATATAPLDQSELAKVKAVLGLTALPTREQWLAMFAKAGFSHVEVVRQAPINSIVPDSPLLNRFFPDWRRIILRNRRQFQYGVYRCVK
jgi:ubiquinone/menaquinone biosynthesis C-methylase UbiE